MLTVFTELYLPPTRVPSGVEFATTVRSVTGGSVFGSRDNRNIDASRSTSTLAYTADVPLRDFRPGMYVLRVEATPSIGESQSVARDVLFDVR